MKKLVILIVAVSASLIGTVIAGSNARFGNEDSEFQANITPRSKEDVYGVLLLNKSENPAYIAIRNAKGRVVYGEKVTQKNTFRKNYNLSKLPQGEYSIEVLGGEQGVTQVVYVQ